VLVDSNHLNYAVSRISRELVKSAIEASDDRKSTWLQALLSNSEALPVYMFPCIFQLGSRIIQLKPPLAPCYHFPEDLNVPM
jgi:hypothetical protein